MEQSWSRAAPATVEHGVGPTTAGGADALTAPRPRTSRGESGSQRTLSRMLVFAVLGSASGAATVEEQLEHTLATGVRSRRCVCATRSVLNSWCMRPHHCSRPRSVSRPCTCTAVGRGRKERRAGRSGCSVNGRRGWLKAQRDVGGVGNGEAQGCYIRERQSSVGEGLRAGARGVRLAPRRQGAAVGAAGRAAPGAAGVVSVMSRARERERDEALEFEFSAPLQIRRNGDERWNGRGNNGMGGARTGRRTAMTARARVSLTIHKKNLY